MPKHHVLQPDLDYFMREPEVERICPVSRVTRWRWERDGHFPKRRQIGPNAIGWLASEVFDWRDQRASAAPKSTTASEAA
jgi:prophage regulatory protein